jgi:hypothetical protein
MQIIVQEGEASVSLLASIQAPDENLRTATVSTVVGPVKVYYRDFEVIRIDTREGSLELMPPAIASIGWIRKDRCYQLKSGG